MKTRFTKPALLSVLAATGLLAAACGGSTSASKASGGSQSSTSAASSTAPSSTAPSSSATSGGGSASGKVTKITLGIIGKNTADWPLFMAIKEGFMKKAGISISIVTTHSPPNSVNELAAGSFQIASDGTDSWVRAVARHLPVEIVAPEFITDPYSLLAQKNIKSWAQLKGKTIILGTKTDVTAISFAAMAKANQMSFKKDFSYVTAGSTNQRYAALMSGHVAAAMLTQPFDFLAKAKGMNVLGTSFKYVPHWMFTAYAANTKWADSHGPVLVKFVKALEEGIQYAYAHPNAAINVMAEESKVPKSEVKQAYNLDFNTWKGFSKNETVPKADVEAVINAVVKQGTVKQAPPFNKLFNQTYIQKANS